MSKSTDDPRATAASSRPLISRLGSTIVVSTALPTVPEVLSESERKVARGLLVGQSNREIARSRGTSPKTVANQLQAIYRKLGVCSRDELTALLVGSPAD